MPTWPSRMLLLAKCGPSQSYLSPEQCNGCANTLRDHKTRRDAVAEFRYLAVRRDAADLAGVGLGKPDIAVGPDQNAVGTCVGCGHREQRDLAAHGGAADLVGLLGAKPHVAVGPPGDPDRHRARLGDREFRKRSRIDIEPPDGGCAAFAEPQMAVRSAHTDVGFAPGRRDLVQPHCGCTVGR